MTLKRTIHTYTEEDGITFELKGEVVDGKCTASVKGVINDIVTVDGTFVDESEQAEALLNQFLADAFSAHGKALDEAFPDVKEAVA